MDSPPTDSTSPAAATSDRLAGLDALRGIAALLVVMQHAVALTLDHTDLYRPLFHSIELGRFGVLLFFLISGFVIPPSLARAGLARFAVNRAFRLLPALWLSVACAATILTLRGDPFTPLDVIANMTMLAHFLTGKLLFGCYWSLSYELVFYAACMALFATGQLYSYRLVGTITVILAMLALAADIHMFAYLFGGMMIRFVHDGRREAIPWAVVTSGALLLAGAAPFADPAFTAADAARWFTGSTLALAVFLGVLRFAPGATSPLLPRLGRASYSIYLFQDIGLWGLACLLQIVPQAYPLAVIALTIMIGDVVAARVERPAIAAGRRLMLTVPPGSAAATRDLPASA